MLRDYFDTSKWMANMPPKLPTPCHESLLPTGELLSRSERVSGNERVSSNTWGVGLSVGEAASSAMATRYVLRHIPCRDDDSDAADHCFVQSPDFVTVALVAEAPAQEAVDPLIEQWLPNLERISKRVERSKTEVGQTVCEDFRTWTETLPPESLNNLGLSATLLVNAWPRVDLVHWGKTLCYLYRSGCLTKLTTRPIGSRLSAPAFQYLDVPSEQKQFRVGDRYLLAGSQLTNLVSLDELQHFFVQNQNCPAGQACRRLADLTVKKSKSSRLPLVVLGKGR